MIPAHAGSLRWLAVLPAWDDLEAVELSPEPMPMPSGEESAPRVLIRYPPAGGYTHGDVYELFIGGNGRILEWIYRRAGSAEPTRMTRWGEYRQVGPLTLALRHPDIQPGFKVWFTDVAVRLIGSEEWILPD